MTKKKPSEPMTLDFITVVLRAEIRRIIREELEAERRRNQGAGFRDRIKTKGI